MKKILKPKEKEDAVYFSDFSGKCLGEFIPITLKIDFDYGSVYDGSRLEFHLNDEDIKDIFIYLKNKLSTDKKNEIQKNLKCLEDDYKTSCEAKDWNSCDLICNNNMILKNLL